MAGFLALTNSWIFTKRDIERDRERRERERRERERREREKRKREKERET